jgi:hypothetical protein
MSKFLIQGTLVNDTKLREAVLEAGGDITEPTLNMTHGIISQALRGTELAQYAVIEWSATTGRFLRATTSRSVVYERYTRFAEDVASGKVWTW